MGTATISNSGTFAIDTTGLWTLDNSGSGTVQLEANNVSAVPLPGRTNTSCIRAVLLHRLTVTGTCVHP